MDSRKYAVIGGDLRNVKLAEAINYDGNHVSLFGFKNAGFSSSLRKRKIWRRPLPVRISS